MKVSKCDLFLFFQDFETKDGCDENTRDNTGVFTWFGLKDTNHCYYHIIIMMMMTVNIFPKSLVCFAYFSARLKLNNSTLKVLVYVWFHFFSKLSYCCEVKKKKGSLDI